MFQPGSNFWAVLLFFTLVVLGFSSAFVMLDVVVTLICDSGMVKASRPVVVTVLTVISFLMCLPYCTEFGYYLLDGIDRWVNNVALIFVVWSEVSCSTTVYRWRDVVEQTGLPAFILYNVGFFGGQVVGISLAHGISNPGAGAGAGIGLWVVLSIVAVVIAHPPTTTAPSIWGRNKFLSKFWYLAFYSVRPQSLQPQISRQLTRHEQGNQIRRDLNVIVGQGKNWSIPSFLPILLRYISGPVLAIIFSFAFPEFHTLRYDPMMITGFILSILTIIVVLTGFVMPRYYDAFIPIERRGEGTEPTMGLVTKGEVAGMPATQMANAEGGQAGLPRMSSSEGESKAVKEDVPPPYHSNGLRA
jgi:solute carrier family 6 GABA transporter-like protein 1